MFTYQKNLKTWTNQVISINEFIDLIKDNPYKDKICNLHTLEYQCKEYKRVKETLPCVKIFGSFSSLKGSSVTEFNSYMYFDIDNTKMTPNDLAHKFPFVTLCTKSVGGRGLFFLVNVTGVDIDIYNHNTIWVYLRDNIFNELNIDPNAYSIPRPVIIPYDPSLYMNPGGSFSVSKESLVKKGKELRQVKTVKVIQRERGTDEYTLNEPLDTKELFNRIKVRTEYTGHIENFYVIDKQDFYIIRIPETIKDGTKHKLYNNITNALVFINPNIVLDDIISFMFIVNSRAYPPMSNKELIRYVTIIYNRIVETGEVNINPRKKIIQFGMNSNLNTHMKQSIAAKANGILRSNRTKDTIEEAIMKLASMNENPSNKRICELTGLSLSTVKRNKKVPKKNPMMYDTIESINEISSEIEKKKEKNNNNNKYVENIKSTTSEDNFFNEEKIIPKSKLFKFNYKGLEDKEIEITDRDKETFMDIIKEIRLEGVDLSESILKFKLPGFDKYKLYYLQNKWISKHGTKNYME